MTAQEIQRIRHERGLSYRQIAKIVNVNESTIRKAAAGEYTLGGAAERMLEMLDRGELPERYL